MTEPLQVGQRVQLNPDQMTPERREIYMHSGPGEIARIENPHKVWIRFDTGWKAAFLNEEIQPEIVQLDLFGNPT